MLQPQGN